MLLELLIATSLGTAVGEKPLEPNATIVLTQTNGDNVIDVREVPESRVDEMLPELGITYDVLRWQSHVPEGACSSLGECADAVQETCEDTDNGDGKMAELDEGSNSCSGTCTTEMHVSIHCFQSVS